MKLTEKEKKKIIEIIEAGKTLPAVYKSKLFDRDDTEFIEATKDYRLNIKVKLEKRILLHKHLPLLFRRYVLLIRIILLKRIGRTC